MNRPQKTYAALAATFLLVAAGVSAQDRPAPSVPPVPSFDRSNPARMGRAIADYLDAFDSGWVDAYSSSRMTLFDARGDSVERDVRQMMLEGEDGDKLLIRFMSPAEIRGVAALIHEHPGATDDSWLYLPATHRVRRISGANRTASFQGTEFTYEDLSPVSPSRYRWRFLAEEHMQSDGQRVPIYKLEAVPQYDNSGYSKIILYVNHRDWRVEKIDFFDLSGQSLKTLVNSRFRTYHDRYPRPSRVEMTNHQTGKRTQIDVQSMFVDLSRYQRRDGSPRPNLTDSQFTRRALEGN